MEARRADIPLRWVALIVALINIAFNSILDNFTSIPSIKDLAYHYNNLFIPASYAFAIWGLIYLLYIVYCIIQLLPSQINKTGYDNLNIPFIIINLLGIVWVYAFRQSLVAFSEVVIIVMLLCSVVLFSMSQRMIRRLNYSRWLSVPFSMLMGWLSVAVIAGTAVFLVSVNWDGMGIGGANWVMIVLGGALLLALLIGVGYKDITYPLVIAWGTFAVWANLKTDLPIPAQAALGVAVVSLLIAVWAMVKQLRYKNKRESSTEEDSL